jgi:hypothetical protein
MWGNLIIVRLQSVLVVILRARDVAASTLRSVRRS